MLPMLWAKHGAEPKSQEIRTDGHLKSKTESKIMERLVFNIVFLNVPKTKEKIKQKTLATTIITK